MKKILLNIFTLAIAVSINTASADAATLTNGLLTVDIREDNGAIDTVIFNGIDFYNPGTPVSNFGGQITGDSSSFTILTTTGVSPSHYMSISSTETSISVTTSKDGFDFTRTYSLVEGLNVLRTTSTLANNTSKNFHFDYFDTFNPDQGIGTAANTPNTYNDVFTLLTDRGLATVGQAYEENGLAVLMGSINSNAKVASGYPFHINNSAELTDFFASPFDGEGSYADNGLHIGIQGLVAAKTIVSFTFDQAYGINPEAAQLNFITANRTPTPAPEPSTMILGLIGIGAAIKKRKATKA